MQGVDLEHSHSELAPHAPVTHNTHMPPQMNIVHVHINTHHTNKPRLPKKIKSRCKTRTVGMRGPLVLQAHCTHCSTRMQGARGGT